jgi:hypothetical protein
VLVFLEKSYEKLRAAGPGPRRRQAVRRRRRLVRRYWPCPLMLLAASLSR